MPARSQLKEYRAQAEAMGIHLMPWQETAARYITALAPGGRHLYREVCIVVARQNGKTTLAQPLIVKALREGKKVMHIAQTRELPRRMFSLIADTLSAEPALFPKRRGKTIWPRFGAGQEEIVLTNGGSYRIAASRNGGARGWSNDLVVIDELLEFDSFEAMGSVEPTLTMSADPQLVQFSNAGDEESVVLNSVRDRRGGDASLAYLEWSASPERAPDDIEGWLEANPAAGHYPSVQKTLEAAYTKHRLAGTMGMFETEHLCRWVETTKPRLVGEVAWAKCQGAVTPPLRPALAVSMDPSGTRASAAIAWLQSDGRVALEIVADVTGVSDGLEAFGHDLRQLALRLKATEQAHDGTTLDLARHLPKSRLLVGREYANASENFARLIDSGRLVWERAEAVSADLAWTARHPFENAGWQAVRAHDEHPVTAALAAIRAVWLASAPAKSVPRVR